MMSKQALAVVEICNSTTSSMAPASSHPAGSSSSFLVERKTDNWQVLLYKLDLCLLLALRYHHLQPSCPPCLAFTGDHLIQILASHLKVNTYLIIW
jgi:hypothetical protein